VGIVTQLEGSRLGVTGVTGFVGQALLARLLDDVPGCRLVVLGRDRPGASAAERIEQLIATNPAFAAVRERDGVDAAMGRIEVVAADLDHAQDLDLPRVDALIHVAGTVSFDTRIDEAFATHTTGVDLLYAAARNAGCEHVVHVSTAYVAARKPGPVPEAPVRDDVDWRVEAAAARELAARADVASRQPARLQRFLEAARKRFGVHGDDAVAEEAEAARHRWVREQLVEAGRQRARTLGFADVYTMTKAMGERVAQERFGDARLTVVRPTIVESSLRHPYPGWIEGFKVADPIIIGLGRGDIPEFPGFPDAVVDVVPVDFVANALIVAAANPPPKREPRYVTAGTGARNPLSIFHMYRHVRDYFDRHPLPGEEGRGVRLPSWRFPGVDAIEFQLRTATKLSRAAMRAIERAPVGGPRLRELGRTINRQERRFDALSKFLDLYGVYAQTETVFLDDNAEALRASLDDEDRETFGFAPTDIDWAHYLGEVHTPSVAKVFRRTRPRRPQPGPPALRDGATDGAPILAVFDLDGTVASTDVLSTYLRARYADDRLAFASEAADVLRMLPRYLGLDAAGRERFLRAFYRRFAGADVAALEELVANELTGPILADLSPAAVRRIREHRDLGHTTVLLTGALRVFCTPLAPLFDHIAAADLEVDGAGRATGHLASPPLVGATRANWLRSYARATGAKPRSFPINDDIDFDPFPR
jgi:nucleoside-diphosphate-sugar epimerase/phosphoserine phosphatase